ncbi:FAD/FMN-containing dehydrogenase [Thermomonospora echinospora]|uniref:FAD/FMN-containing dehydrogenase n=1 Tax=Thermomonospora echinospora TaxID=1992 RepID=A0A1H6D5N4_9ACTN|nr:FAD-binding protein [Thermomonospora echinospora]SEG80571.1 FAD/FMN-containing dehydrogenase [Thermomonospora echinospora]
MIGDFGGIVRLIPRQTVRPATAGEVAAVLRAARVPVVPRGYGHSTYGQAQVADGVLLDMRGLRTVHEVRPDRVVVDAGATWREVLDATLPRGRTPPVLTDYLDVTVGGTLAAGGVGGTSHRYGVQADQVLALEVATPAGEVVTCSPEENRALFDAVRAGLGRHGVITRAVLRLVPAPERVRSFKLLYATAGALLDAQRRIPADHISGQAKLGLGLRYELTAVCHDPGRRIDGAFEEEELPYAEFADRMRPDVEELIRLGEWARPHPWGIVFLPARRAAEVIETTLAETGPTGLGLSGVVLISPLTVRDVPALRVPADPVMFALLRTASPGAASPDAMVAANRRLHERARRVGGTRYPIDAAPPDPHRPVRTPPPEGADQESR